MGSTTPLDIGHGITWRAASMEAWRERTREPRNAAAAGRWVAAAARPWCLATSSLERGWGVQEKAP
eukprot:9336124-Pyramimonas_sp.AAC.1